jgi:hypothetical protein
MRFKITIEDKRKEGVPLFTLITSIGGGILAALAAMIGVTPHEQRAILVILATLFFWSILAVLYTVDQAVRLHFYAQELYYRYIRRIARERDQALERAKAKRIEIDTMRQTIEQLERDLRDSQRDLEERERQLGSEQRKNKLEAADKEALRTEAQAIITGLKAQIESLKEQIETMKTQGQAKAEYALLILLIVIVCIGLLTQISIFPLTVLTQLTEMIVL